MNMRIQFAAAVLIAISFTADSALAFRTGALAGHNGSVASGGDTCMVCHGNNAGTGSVEIIGAPVNYVPNEFYELTVRISDPDQAGAGFQISVEDGTGNHVGSLNIIDDTNTRDAPGDPGWITHTATGVDNAVANWGAMGNAAEYTAQWQAPPDDAGTVTFFAAGNAINNNSLPTGDIIYLTSVISQAAMDCDDGVDCTIDEFIDGACVSTPDDAACPDDGQFCNGSEFCDAALGCSSTGSPCPGGAPCDEATDSCGECVTDGDCDDGIACTVDSCVAGNCVNDADDALCADDGLFCTGEETCDPVAGCVSTGSPCAAGQTCDEESEACIGCVDGVPCSDDNACTENDTCVEGICVGDPIENCCTSSTDCADTNDCTSDVCFQNQCFNEEIVGCRDTDDDSIPDVFDACPNTPLGETADADGCSCSQRDTDNDGVHDCDDVCPATSTGAITDDDGCTCAQLDDDGDGVDNCDDACPDTPGGETVNETGCGCSQRDSEDDSINDCDDLCPQTPAEAEPNADGCALQQLDSDDDGITDDLDQCTQTPPGSDVDEDGCPTDAEPGAQAPQGDDDPTSARRSLCGAMGLIAPMGLLLAVLMTAGFRRRDHS